MLYEGIVAMKAVSGYLLSIVCASVICAIVSSFVKERKQIIGGIMEICDDGKLYMLMPLPEGVSKEEIDAAVAEGEISLRDGMMIGGAETWEDRDGVLWYTTALSEDGWTKGLVDEGFVFFMTIRFVRAE